LAYCVQALTHACAPVTCAEIFLHWVYLRQAFQEPWLASHSEGPQVGASSFPGHKLHPPRAQPYVECSAGRVLLAFLPVSLCGTLRNALVSGQFHPSLLLSLLQLPLSVGMVIPLV
jgi:hypothetical protein